ncbi:hypothetical protein EDC01DRAFT_672633 [Geopyxis carbonaria]|nr:hypothetical protein EDC01DRAFT_672633 [Geopyxis carbonaria]
MDPQTTGGMLPPPPPLPAARFDASQFQAPPSSIAVIVQNLTKANDGSNGRPSEETTQLLEELYTEINEGGEELNDGILGYRLIPLVTAKGFVTLSEGDDPFSSDDIVETRLKQTSSTLVVIQIAIRRTPQSLFGHYPDENGSQGEIVFLGLWLLPKLFGLLNHPLAQSLSGDVLATMESIFSAAARDAQYWPHFKAMSKYCQSCLNCIWDSSKDNYAVKSVLHGSYELELPAFDFNVDTNVWRHISSLDLQQVRFTIHEPENAASLGLNLLKIFSRLCASGGKNPVFKEIMDGLPGNQQGISKLWRELEVWDKLPKLREKSESIRLQALDTLSLILEDMSERAVSKTRVDEVYLFALRCILSIINRGVEANNQPMETAVAGIILTLLGIPEKPCLVEQFLMNRVIPVVLSIVSNQNKYALLSNDLVIALAMLVVYADDIEAVEKIQPLLEALEGKWSCQDPGLAKKLEILTAQTKTKSRFSTRLPRKRPRLDGTAPEALDATENTLALEICSLLGNGESLDPDTLSKFLDKFTVDNFVKLSEEHKCSFVENLGIIACAEAGDLKKEGSALRVSYECTYCDSNFPKRIRKRHYAKHDSELFVILEKISRHEDFTHWVKVRCGAIESLKRLSNHTQDLRYLDIGCSELGSWCLNSLNSSRREIRLAAGRTLPSFLNFTHDSSVVSKNRALVLGYLRKFSTSENPHLYETSILAWGHLGRSSTGEELNLILLQLVENFGNASNFLVGVAFNELSEIAEAHDLVPRKLITPFYRTISPDVVRQLKSKPQVIEHLARFMCISVDEFLHQTRKYTLPHLILWKKDDVVQTIAQTVGMTVQTLCHQNIPSILSVLFIQEWDDLEESAMAALRAISPHFASSSLGELVRPDASKLAAELLKLCGDAVDEREKRKTVRALELISKFTYRKPPKGDRVPEDYLGLFFETQALGLCIIFSDNLKEPLGQTPMLEKVRCVKAIREMLLLATKSITSALPQICTCLLSAMDFDDLRTSAFNAWSALVGNLSANDLTPLFSQTFSLVLHYWDVFEDAAKTNAKEMIDLLFQNHLHPLKSSVASIPPLSGIPLFAKADARLTNWRKELSTTERLHHLSRRCRHENEIVVEQALVELACCLEDNQEFFHTSVTTEKVEEVIPEVFRCLLDVTVESKGSTDQAKERIRQLCAECLGLTGAMDPTLVEARRPQSNVVVLGNFSDADESIRFIIYILQYVLVPTFLSTKDTKAQGFLAWTMQELLQFCELDQNTVSVTRQTSEKDKSQNQRKWDGISPKAREVLMPFLSSKYKLTTLIPNSQPRIYPIFESGVLYKDWITWFICDLLQKPHGQNTTVMFEIFLRICSRGSNATVSSVLLPYVVLHVVISGNDEDRANIIIELLAVLKFQEQSKIPTKRENLQKISESVFSIIDYMTKWIHSKRDWISRLPLVKGQDINELFHDADILCVEQILNAIPPDLMGKRSVELKSYARALLYTERHIRKVRTESGDYEKEPLYEDLQRIYAHIDEPDGMEGISSKIISLDLEQQALEHRKAGRWTAAQSWYEMQLQKKPHDFELQADLIACLKDAGQYNTLLSQVDAMSGPGNLHPQLLVHAVETSWIVGRWDALDRYLAMSSGQIDSSYEICLGRALSALRRQDAEAFHQYIQSARTSVVASMTTSNTNSLRQCHDHLVRLHGLAELEGIIVNLPGPSKAFGARHLDARLELMGTYSKDKQYILALRRAAFELLGNDEALKDMKVSAWLKTAKLARKDGEIIRAFGAIHNAMSLRPELAAIEDAKLLWHQGDHQSAIRKLNQALELKVLEFDNEEVPVNSINPKNSMNAKNSVKTNLRNIRVAKAKLLYAKWIDHTGRTQSPDILRNYNDASDWWVSWEQGFYYIGRHYNKHFEAEKSLERHKQSQLYVNGELSKLVVVNYLRAVAHGVKYIFQTIPRLLTLWLDLGEDILHPIPEQYGLEVFRRHAQDARMRNLDEIHEITDRYLGKLGAWTYFTAFPQILSRIIHPHEEVYPRMQMMIVKVLRQYPQQALWSVMAVIKSTNRDRASRGQRVMAQLKKDRSLINQAQRLIDQLLYLSNKELPPKTPRMNLSSEIGFKVTVAPCSMVIPAQAILTVTLPSPGATGTLLTEHKAFAEDQPTIDSFLEEVIIMSSLQRPRKITIRGSDGLLYHFLCKPKDDLRKDARLMEFNSMINRFLKKDFESRRRSLYIRTYSVTPLNEECGLIEWVNNVQTLRDVISRYLKARGIVVDYQRAAKLLGEACKTRPPNAKIFTDIVLPKYPAVFHEWFLDTFSEPSTWFESRLRYTRTAAVMSMVGYILGLGDRHGENILVDQINGDTLHVDFNCLFDKGQSFEKPERVPFRLTHNMVDAMGIAGYEGVFRKASESAMRLLRHNDETMMTVLETFIHDPAVDMISRKKRPAAKGGDTSPKEVLNRINRRLKGLWEQENVPLSVEGQVESLIKKAIDPVGLCDMYIGWCPFL